MTSIRGMLSSKSAALHLLMRCKELSLDGIEVLFCCVGEVEADLSSSLLLASCSIGFHLSRNGPSTRLAPKSFTDVKIALGLWEVAHEGRKVLVGVFLQIIRVDLNFLEVGGGRGG